MSSTLKHGMARRGAARSAEYRAWWNMINRCKNPVGRNRFYAGISVAKEFEKFEGFFAELGIKPAGATLDRIDSKDDYRPGNVRWAPPLIQNQNRSNSLLITHNGKTQSLTAWSVELGIGYGCLTARLYRYKWPTEKALFSRLHTRINRAR